MDTTQDNKIDNKPQDIKASRWTPELAIQVVKEGVTALLGLVIIVFTLVLLEEASGHIDKPDEFNRAKEVLLIVNGLAGVVLGYYFGRVPADARATQAQGEADAARKETQEVENTCANALNKVQTLLEEQSVAARVGGKVRRAIRRSPLLRKFATCFVTRAPYASACPASSGYRVGPSFGCPGAVP